MKYNLEDEVKDTVTDFQGIITAIHLYLNELPKYAVQPRCDVSYILPEVYMFPEKRLLLINSANTLRTHLKEV